MDYKIHLFLNIGNNKLNTSRMQCGRKMWANSKGAFAMKTRQFLEHATMDTNLVCANCLAWYNENKKGA
jgi:hypothetical protein